ncbi:MAG: GyrI-like domain-containing protein [Candidatus Zixiibacteriota bacterium]|jgi:effector-binding domain-containing protein
MGKAVVALLAAVLAAGTLAFAGEIEVHEKKVADVEAATARFRGQYEEVGKYMEALYATAGEAIAGPCFALYHEGDTEEGHDIEACVPVSADVEGEGISTRTIPGANVIYTIHRGAYGPALGETWGELMAYIQDNGLVIAGPAREVYLEWNPDDPEKYVTELQVPLEKK